MGAGHSQILGPQGKGLRFKVVEETEAGEAEEEKVVARTNLMRRQMEGSNI